MRARFVLAAVFFVGCGGSEDTVPPPGDSGTDTRIDATDSASDATDATSTTDGGLDASDSADGTSDTTDGATSATEGSLAIKTLFQDCMPIVAKDPLHMQATATIKNVGTGKVGPITITDGAILDSSGKSIATFKVTSSTIAEIAGGASGSGAVEKNPDTLDPATGCSSVPCGSDVFVEVTYVGVGIVPGSKARSPLTKITCAL